MAEWFGRVAGHRLLFGIVAAAAALAAILVLAAESEATHFRGGTMYAVAVDPENDPYTVRLHAILYIRNTFPTNPTQLGYGPAQLGQCCPPIVPEGTLGGLGNSGTMGSICFGDGECRGQNAFGNCPDTADWVPRSFYADTVNDFVGYRAFDLDGAPGLLHTYSGAGPWKYYYGQSVAGDTCTKSACCHLSYGPVVTMNPAARAFHYNNPDRNMRLEGFVTLPAQQPYKSNMQPIKYCNPDALCIIPLTPTFAPTGSPYSVRFASAQETGNTVWYQPGPCPNAGGPCLEPNPSYICGNAFCWWANGNAQTSPPPDWPYYSVSVQLLGADTDRAPLEWLIVLNPQPLWPDDPPPPPPTPPPPPPPVARFRTTQADLCGWNPVQFTDMSSGPEPITTWHWDFGDNTDSGAPNPSHLYQEGGAYRVTLTVTDERGLVGRWTRIIGVTGYNDCPAEQYPAPEWRPGRAVRDGQDEELAGLDSDGDGAPDAGDNCPGVSNRDQRDTDADGLGDLCDDDLDGDRVPNASDNCAAVANVRQADLDRDAAGDLCDADLDGDAVPNDVDNCPADANTSQADVDGDGLGDACAASADEVLSGAARRFQPERDASTAELSVSPSSGARASLAVAGLVTLAALVLVMVGLRRRRPA